jgi:outer membrane biosynthesis protein TonB
VFRNAEKQNSTELQMEESVKKRIITIVAVSLLLVGTVIVMRAQQDQAKPIPQQTKPSKPESKPSEAKPEPGGRTQPGEQQKQTDEQQKHAKQEQQKQASEQRRRAQDEDNDQQTDRHEAQAQGSRPGSPQRGVRIPDDRFREHFGRNHKFRVERIVLVENRPRFQYTGYWFELIDPWPADWSYSDDCYVDYIDEEYFLINPMHPGIRLAVIVVD